MEGVTLLESGTSRAHFALVKQLEQSNSSASAHSLALHTLTLLRSTLSRTSYASPTSLCSPLLVLLHLLRSFPDLESTASVASWALVPSLHLAATAQTSKQVSVAYQLVTTLLLIDEEEEQGTSLLQLNTLRSHLTNKLDSPLARVRLHCALVHVIEVLRAGKLGTESLPALWAPLLYLTRCIYEGVRQRAIHALDLLSRLGDEFSKAVARSRFDEVLLQAHVTLSSSPDKVLSKGKEKQRTSNRSRSIRHEEAEVPQHTGPETSNSVRLTALRGLGASLRAKEVQPESVAEHALQVVRRASSDATSQTVLLLGALELLIECAHSTQLSPQLVVKTRSETLHLLVLLAPLQVGSAYALQLASSQLLGRLHVVASSTFSSTNNKATSSAETTAEEAGWAALHATLKAHLSAKNANRKALGVRMLHALVPLGWAAAPPSSASSTQEEVRIEHEQTGSAAEEQKEAVTERHVERVRVLVEPSEFEQLMRGLVHSDSTVRVLTLRLLYAIDTSIVQQHLTTLRGAVTTASLGEREAHDVARRALESAWIMASCAMQRQSNTSKVAQEYADVVYDVMHTLRNSKAVGAQSWVLDIVSADVRGGETNFGALVTQAILQRLSTSTEEKRDSTECLLISALLAEWADGLYEVETQRERLLAVLSAAIGNASNEEALLLALVRLSALRPIPSTQHLTRVEGLLSNDSVQQLAKGTAIRARQYVHLARDEHAAKLVSEAAGPSTSLLDLIEALDAYFATPFSSSAALGTKVEVPPTASLSSPKPLRFEPYAPPTASLRNFASQTHAVGAWNDTERGKGTGTVANVVEALGASVSRLNFSLTLKDEWGEGGRYASASDPTSKLPLLEQEEEEDARSPAAASTSTSTSRGSKGTSTRPDLILFDAESER